MPQAAEDAQEHFLRYVFGVGPTAEHPHRQAEHLRLKLLHQLAHRDLIARQATLDRRSQVVRQPSPQLGLP